MATHTRILAAIGSESVFSQFEPLMSRSDLELTRVRSGRHALTLASDLPFELVIGQHPLADLEFREFHTTLRSRESASRTSPLLVLTRDDRLDELSETVDDVDAQMFCIDLAPEQVEKALAEIIGVAVRTNCRLLVQTSLDCLEGETRKVHQTINVSETGLLFRSDRVLPIGARIEFSLDLPETEDPLLGVGQVVRHTEPESEEVEGTAIRFLRLEGEARSHLADFIRREVAKSPWPVADFVVPPGTRPANG